MIAVKSAFVFLFVFCLAYIQNILQQWRTSDSGGFRCVDNSSGLSGN